jgi:LmbE family N-acetylglucosaminyl deacetylase
MSLLTAPSQPLVDLSALDRTWSRTRRRAKPLRLPAVSTLVVAPHPDDETLMAGGLIAAQRARGLDVHVLAITDGEAAYESANGQDLAARRRSEQVAALDELGVGADWVTRMAVPDGAVADHIDEITDAIASFDHVGLVVAPWTGDHHCDHEAVGAAARNAVARTNGALIFGLFWTWHHRTPDELADEQFLELGLDASARHRRRLAIDCHRSQFEQFEQCDEPPQLTENLIGPLRWGAEYYLSPRLHSGGSTDGHHGDIGLITGVPPVTAGPSEVQT